VFVGVSVTYLNVWTLFLLLLGIFPQTNSLERYPQPCLGAFPSCPACLFLFIFVFLPMPLQSTHPGSFLLLSDLSGNRLTGALPLAPSAPLAVVNFSGTRAVFSCPLTNYAAWATTTDYTSASCSSRFFTLVSFLAWLLTRCSFRRCFRCRECDLPGRTLFQFHQCGGSAFLEFGRACFLLFTSRCLWSGFRGWHIVMFRIRNVGDPLLFLQEELLYLQHPWPFVPRFLGGLGLEGSITPAVGSFTGLTTLFDSRSFTFSWLPSKPSFMTALWTTTR